MSTMASSTRRQFLATTAGLAVGAGMMSQPVASQSAGGDLSTWFENSDAGSEIADKRGSARVEIAVGASGNGGAFAFDPAVVRIDPDTTVVWTWTGNGGTHNVVAEDESFASDYHDSKGETFEQTPASTGIIRYACAPHKAMGMKGALVVGETAVSLAIADESMAQEGTETPPAETFDGWLENTDNYGGVIDKRGASEVTVEVGAEGNGGDFAFAPAAIRVDPGTTVVWDWVGGEQYDVVDSELDYRSETVTGSDHMFAVEFGGNGLSTYECTSYSEQGMRGVIVVGEGPITELSTTGLATIGGVGALLTAPLLYGLREHIRDTTQYTP